MIPQDYLILILWEELYPRNVSPPSISLKNNQYFVDESQGQIQQPNCKRVGPWLAFGDFIKTKLCCWNYWRWHQKLSIAKNIECPDSYFNLKILQLLLMDASKIWIFKWKYTKNSRWWLLSGFSYSSIRVDYDTWNDPVSILNHSVGYKKFSIINWNLLQIIKLLWSLDFQQI